MEIRSNKTSFIFKEQYFQEEHLPREKLYKKNKLFS